MTAIPTQDGTEEASKPPRIDNISSVNVTGSDGRDFLYGMTKSDTLNGEGGNDTVYGWNPGTPKLPATPEMGSDTLSGWAGNDDDILSGKGWRPGKRCAAWRRG